MLEEHAEVPLTWNEITGRGTHRVDQFYFEQLLPFLKQVPVWKSEVLSSTEDNRECL